MGLNENVKIGSTDTDSIVRIQKSLGMEPSGEFDSETEECVKKFQEYSKIKEDGIVGPITQGKLDDILLGKLTGWKGCKSSKSDSTDVDSPVKKMSGNVVGSKWKSCLAWRSSGGLSSWGDKFKVENNSSQFKITYNGPSSGLNIAHAAGGTDTIHQLYNVLICEINPFLSSGGLKPDIEQIQTSSNKNGSNTTLSITIPLSKSPNTYQLDRRGGWNHDPGGSKMSSKCKEIESQGGKCFGPIKNVAEGPFGKITEYFITHTI